MTDAHLESWRDGCALVLAFNRPDVRNALSPGLLADVTQRIETAADDPAIRVIVLRGREEGPFSSGYDLGTLSNDRVSPEQARTLQAPIRALTRAIASAPKPVIAAVRRYAIGAALDLVAHCDLRVGEAGAKFSLPAARLGFVYPFEGVARLSRILGHGSAERLLLLGDTLCAEELEPRGFLHRVWSSDEFEAQLKAFLATFEALAPLALRGLKRSLTAAATADLGSECAIEQGYIDMAESLNSQDAREGPRALREKRPPKFVGR